MTKLYMVILNVYNIECFCFTPPYQCVARFGTICTILKNVKNTDGRVLLSVKLQVESKFILDFSHFAQIMQCNENQINRIFCALVQIS